MKYLYSTLLGLLGMSLIITGFAAVPSTGPNGESSQGLFATYFSNLAQNPCSSTEVIAGFNQNSGNNYLKSNCVSIGSILGSFFGSFTQADTDEALSGFNPTTGAPIYKSVNGVWKNVTSGVAYTGGNVGIGNPNPALHLEILDSINTPIGMRVANEGIGNAAISVYQVKTQGSHSWVNMLLNDMSGNPYFQIGAGEGVKYGYFNLPNYYFASSTGTHWMSITNNGNVGVGTTGPTKKLDVNGDANVNGDLSVDGLIIGGKRMTLPPVCTGSNKYLQWDGDDWGCVTLTGATTTNPTNLKVYVSNSSYNDLSNQNGTIYRDQVQYFILDGVDSSNPPKGCAKPAGSSGCSDPSGFRTYGSHEWISSTRIVSEGVSGIAPYTFPAGNYEFYVLYGTTITKVGTATLIDNTSNLKVYVSNSSYNDLSNQNGTIYRDQVQYFILDGVDSSNPPKGCAKPAGSSGCSDPSGFRTYGSHEWISSTRIVSEGVSGIAPYTFPAGNYEFYVLYGTTITKVGTATLVDSVIAPSCDPSTATYGTFPGSCGGGGAVDTEYFCNTCGEPGGGGWYLQSDGCYHRCL